MVKKLLSRLSALLLVLVGESGLAVSAAEQTGTITFGTANVKINAAEVTGADDLGNTWTITTTGTTSFTSNASYYQVGSSKAPAESITFTTTLPKRVKITGFEAKFGGFSGTTGDVALMVDETTIGSGALNATSDVVVSASSESYGTVLTVSVTNIDKGVKVYYVSYTYNVSDKKSAGISVRNIEMDATTDSTSFYTLTDENYDGEISFSSSDPTVANVVGDVLKAYKPGTATISLTATETEAYDGDTYAFNVKVTSKPAVTPEGSNLGGGYVLVTDASTLAAGDKIILVGKNDNDDFALSTTQNTNNRGEKKVTIDGTTIASIPGDVQIITLEGETGAWYLNVGSDAYLYAASSSSNYMKTGTKATVGDNGKATISIGTDGAATITFQGSYSHNVLRYNSSSNIFSCYAANSSQNPVYIYRENNETSFDVEIGSTGWRTLVSAVNVSLPTGVKAYIVTASTKDKATLYEVATVKANTPVLLNGAQGDCTLNIVESADEPTGNLLQISTNSTGNGVYVLANKSNGVGFYKWTGGSLGAGRVYLPAPSTDSAREFLSINHSEMTGIENVDSEVAPLRFFDMQGRRVAQPTKGLYIVNGKKVIIK